MVTFPEQFCPQAVGRRRRFVYIIPHGGNFDNTLRHRFCFCNCWAHLYLTLLEHHTTTHHTYILKNSQLVFLPFEVSLYHRTKRQVNGKNYCSKYTTHEQSHSIQRVAVLVDESHHFLPIKSNNFFFFADFREAVYKCLQRRAYFSGT